MPRRKNEMPIRSCVVLVPGRRRVERGLHYLLGLLGPMEEANTEPAPEREPDPKVERELERAKRVFAELWDSLSDEERQMWDEERQTKEMEREWGERSTARLKELEAAEGDAL